MAKGFQSRPRHEPVVRRRAPKPPLEPEEFFSCRETSTKMNLAQLSSSRIKRDAFCVCRNLRASRWSRVRTCVHKMSDLRLWHRGIRADTASDNDDEPRPVLTFFPDELHCDDWGLEIDDGRDFSLAGLDDAYDRSDDLGKWAAQQDYWTSDGALSSLMKVEYNAKYRANFHARYRAN